MQEDAPLPFDKRGINSGHSDDLISSLYSANGGESIYKGGEWTTSSPKDYFLKHKVLE
jgi:hypothetical protein